MYRQMATDCEFQDPSSEGISEPNGSAASINNKDPFNIPNNFSSYDADGLTCVQSKISGGNAGTVEFARFFALKNLKAFSPSSERGFTC
mmetsp:Transcript_5149/g.11342  ORF Transcript_5149/g.11342 Transcript_5149/m.11342 type:complete len:89 (-) Transcript_5149:2139-2405(-)